MAELDRIDDELFATDCDAFSAAVRSPLAALDWAAGPARPGGVILGAGARGDAPDSREYPSARPCDPTARADPPTVRLRRPDPPTVRMRPDPPTVRLRPPDPPTVRLRPDPPTVHRLAQPASPYTADENGTEIVALLGLAILVVVAVGTVAIVLWLVV